MTTTGARSAGGFSRGSIDGGARFRSSTPNLQLPTPKRAWAEGSLSWELGIGSRELTVVFYITGHGFGHAVRQIAIVNALAQRRAEVPIVVRTSVAAWLFGRSVRASVRLEPGPVDTGAIQRGSLDVDVPATLAAAQAFYADGDAWVAREAAFLADAGARLVVADIPPLPIAAARQAGVPAIGISNFTWDWIYEDYEARRLAPGLVETLQAHYASAGEGWRL